VLARDGDLPCRHERAKYFKAARSKTSATLAPKCDEEGTNRACRSRQNHSPCVDVQSMHL
jgi:hypothetical protein